MLLPPSAFFIIGFLIWLIRSWKTEQVEQPDFEKIKLDAVEESA
jgi:Na+-transporting NADH:ubiquinone oxidoreductase subunit D